jgi:hypothetical protein
MTNANAATATDDTRPIPPRYWWLKRILLAVGVLILALAALRWWWGYEAQRRLQAKIDEYHALGQPVTIEDFQFPPVPDEENAAHFLMKAAEAVVVPAGVRVDVTDVCNDLELVAAYVDDVQRIVEANDEVVPLVRQGIARQEADWGTKLTSPVIAVLLPNLSLQRRLARFLCVTALYDHQIGNDTEAVQLLRDALRQAELVPLGQPSLISHLVEIAIQALAVGAVEEIAPGLRIAGRPTGESAGVTRVDADDVRALMADLLREDTLREHWRQAMYAERLSCLDSVNVAATTPAGIATLTASPAPPQPLGWPLKPMFQLDAVFMMEFSTAIAEAGMKPDYVTAQAAFPRYPAFADQPERTAHLMANILLPSYERALELHFRLTGERRMAATALAIRLYEIDHGQRPRTLAELVPTYLLAVPLDPFVADGRTVSYLPDAPTPILYCVGLDAVDDGGEYIVRDSGSVDGDLKDQPFFLDGDRPRAPFSPSSDEADGAEAVEDNGEEVGDRGQPDQDQATDDEP